MIAMETSSSAIDSSNNDGPHISDGFIDSLLKLSSENKFNEKNCWKFPIRESLVFFQRRQESSMSSLIKAGSLAEACTKIYGYRVDSVYTRVKSSYLRLKDSNEEANAEASNDMMDDNGLEGDEEQSQKKPKKVRKRKSEFIVKERPTLLASIQTKPRGNLILENKNKRSSDSNFVSGLLQNILMTRDFVLQLDPATKYWDTKSIPEAPSSDYSVSENRADFLDDVMPFTMPAVESLNFATICPSFAHCNVRIDRESSSPGEWNAFDEMRDGVVGDTDRVVFDMDEPMMNLDVDDAHHSSGNNQSGGSNGNGNQMPSFNENNITDADVERFIERNAVWNDVQPEQYGMVKRFMARMAKNSRNTQGSLKFVEFYDSYWAGPAYWKFKRARASQVPRTVGQAAKEKRRKDAGEKEIVMEDVSKYKFVPLAHKLRELDPKRVDGKNVLMPRNHKVPRDILIRFTHTPWMTIYDLKEAKTNADTTSAASICGQNDYEDDFGWQNDAGGGPMDEMEQGDHLNISHLSANLDGAPVKSDPIILPYSKINKNVDMHELKTMSKKILADRRKTKKSDQQAITSLKDLFADLPPELSKENAEHLSLAITFSALLHVAHEDSLKLQSNADFTDVMVV